jgi:hypothetical protein
MHYAFWKTSEWSSGITDTDPTVQLIGLDGLYGEA